MATDKPLRLAVSINQDFLINLEKLRTILEAQQKKRLSLSEVVRQAISSHLRALG